MVDDINNNISNAINNIISSVITLNGNAGLNAATAS